MLLQGGAFMFDPKDLYETDRNVGYPAGDRPSYHEPRNSNSHGQSSSSDRSWLSPAWYFFLGFMTAMFIAFRWPLLFVHILTEFGQFFMRIGAAIAALLS